MGDLRPIALCNVLYKIASKVVANKLKDVLPDVMSETQSVFIKGRLIIDNIVVANEILHYMKNKIAGREGVVAIKIDISKAYNKME